MSIRTILTPFANDADIPAVHMALSIAGDLGAHLDAVHVEPPARYVPAADRAAAVSGMGKGPFAVSSPGAEPATVPDTTAETTRLRDEASALAKASFQQLCATHGVRFLDPDDAAGQGADHPLPSASYRREAGPVAEVIGRHAHAYDLMVAESASVAKESKAARAAIETALLQAGRPVLLAPSRPPEHLDGPVLVAWNDSPQCWHALSTALPFMTNAKEVVLFHAGKGLADRSAEERAADYLAWHGIHAEVVQQEPGPVGVADYLMSQCSERQVGLLVMGAYSHSPLRERLFGGVTVTVLSNVAATPVLMMH